MAIAFDTVVSNTSATATSLTYSHTTTGTNRFLIVWHLSNTWDFSTGVTYAGVAMTLITKKQVGATSAWTYLYVLSNPASGANNIVISVSSSTLIYGTSVSYTGVKQSNSVDASGTSSITTAALNLSTTISTTVANCWTVCYSFNNQWTWTSNSDTIRWTNTGVNFFDTNALIASPSSKTMTQTVSMSGSSASHMVSIAPFVVSVTNSALLAFM